MGRYRVGQKFHRIRASLLVPCISDCRIQIHDSQERPAFILLSASWAEGLRPRCSCFQPPFTILNRTYIRIYGRLGPVNGDPESVMSIHPKRRGPGRPRDLAKLEAILDAAYALFLERGVTA